MKGIGLGVLAAIFFAVTFVLNRSMEISGGSWMWSASLRYFFMVPFLFAIVGARKGLGAVKREMTAKPWPFFAWSFVAFVLFYGPLTFSAAYAPRLAASWNLAIDDCRGGVTCPAVFHHRRNRKWSTTS